MLVMEGSKYQMPFTDELPLTTLIVDNNAIANLLVDAFGGVITHYMES